MHVVFTVILSAVAGVATITRAPNFAIKAKVPSNSDLEVAKGWNLTSYHITPCYDYAVFTNETGRTFYANGTSTDFSKHTSNIATDGGTPPWPWGVIVSAANATDTQGRRNVYIDCGEGTPGVAVVNSLEGSGPTIRYGTGSFYVCNSTLLYGPAIALYYRERLDATPQGCSNVELTAQCLDDQTEHELQEDSWCYQDSD